MKFVEPRPYADPDAAARKLVEIASTIEPVQNERLYIELVSRTGPEAKGSKMITHKIALAVGIALLAGAAQAQPRTFYDAAGRVTSRATIDANGTTTFHNASGFVTGRARTDANSTTRFYDASSRVAGKAR
jgi:YD repeat-containing protein